MGSTGSRGFRKKLFTVKGVVKEQYQGMEGYAEFAEEVYEGNMQRTFQNVSAILGKEDFLKLGWKQFHGSVQEFYQFIEDYELYYPKDYQTQTGQQRVADEVFSGNTKKTYMMLSTMKDFLGLSVESFQQLGWIKQ